DRLGACALPARGDRRAHRRLRALRPGTGGAHLMDAALSRNGRRLLQALFLLVVVFLYAPIVILLVFSFNDSALPSFPLSGFSLLLLFHQLGIPRSIFTVVIGHIVISLPYTILVLVPRLEQIDASLEEAAYDLGASHLRTFRSVTLPLILPAILSAFLIAFTTSFDEYAVASFVVGTRVTFPIYLYAALRFPTQLPQVIAVA